MDRDLLNSTRLGKMRKGKRELIQYLEGGKLTRMQAIKAHCYDCSGMGELKVCTQNTCTLLPFSPFRAKSSVFEERQQ